METLVADKADGMIVDSLDMWGFTDDESDGYGDVQADGHVLSFLTIN